MKTILLLLISIPSFSQLLHHQMLSSQGDNSFNNGYLTVRQTIGQQSFSGSFRDANLIALQGFQQSNKFSTSMQPNVTISTITYPNPIIDEVNFRFSTTISGPIKISIFDTMGRLVYYKEKLSVDNVLTVDNLSFAQGEYIVTLSSKNYSYSTNLLK